MEYLLLLSIGLTLITGGLIGLRNARLRQQWLETPISIHHASIAVYKDSVGPSVLSYYYPDIHFTYQFGNQPFKKKDFGLSKREYWSTDLQKAEAVLEAIIKNPVAFINPTRPSECCLIRGNPRVNRSHNIALITSGMLLVLSAAGVFWLRR